MYLVQTVSSQPRTWSSYTNVSVREAQAPQKMNSAEEISKYHDNNGHYCSPVLARRAAGTNYDFPEKSPKKDKKWSLGSLFRRKKKPGSESSSEEENEARHFLQKKKKKADKRKRVNKVTGFDHVVVSPSSRHTAFPNGYKASDDPAAVLSEPNVTRPVSKNFIPASDFTTTLVPLKDGQENLERSGLDRSNNSLGSPSVNSLGRRRKEFVKARAAARRDTSKGDDSSDEDSQRSAFRSDESLTKHRDSSLSRKSRAARTQRYLKRRSKDEEPQDQLRVCKSDVEHDCPRNFQYLKLPDERLQNIKSASKSPILSATPKSKLCYTNSAPSTRPNFSGLSTIPPAHSSLNKYRAINFANGSMQKHSSFFDYNSAGNKNAPADLNNQRSLSCGANIYNSAPSPSPSPEVVHVQFSLGKPFQNRRPNSIVAHQINLGRRQPPPPPPRDPRRIINFQNHDGRPISYSFENGSQSNAASDQQLNKIQVAESNHARNLNSARRSTSEDHISWDASQRVPLVPRPSSATPEMSRLQKLGKTENSNGYRYLADKNPRSRKPICIQSCKSAEKPSSSPIDQPNQFSKPFDFWKQKDEEINQINGKQSVPNSPLMFTAQTRVRTNIFLPNGVKVETNPQETRREVSPFRPITPPKPLSPDKIETSTSSVDDTDTMRRKSSNLEDALDELEAIYNSLHLGDEDLLERAEQRETEAAQKRRDAAFESFPNSVSRGALSDSSFGYDFNFDTRRKRRLRKPEPDLKTDDMAFRKLNRDRYNTISDPQAVVSKVSYLLTSPVFNAPTDESSSQKVASKNKEPDVTFDDVVYRNVKHTNNTLKVIDPQPPFGIPVGPILPASNSDYLHAAPETTQRFTFKPKRVPDVVKDDLAYRNLRKDPNKEPALPPFNLNPDDYLNNNGDTFKKKRAVRSLSANIFNLTHKDGKLTGNNISLGDDSEFKEQNIGDVADALEIARQILKEKDNNITATRKAFMSDGELKHNKYEGLSPNEQRVNFLKELKTNCFNNDNVYHHKLQVNIPKIDYDRLNSKPPTPDRSRKGSRTSKESTPIPLSPSEETHIKKQQQSVIDDLLASLAAEANETNERIDDELKRYEGEIERKPLFENCFKDRLLEEQKEEKREKLKELEKDAIAASFNLQVSDANGDSNSEHAKLCEKLLECVIESADLMTATKQEPEPSEEVAKIADEPPLPKTVANIVLTPNDVNPISTEIFSESEHDYANIQSPEETEVETTTKDGFKENDDEEEFRIAASLTDDDEEKALLIDDDIVSLDICTSPLDRRETNRIKEDEMIRDIRMSRYNESEGESSRIIEQTDKGGGEECVSVQYIALPTEGCAFTNESHYDFDYIKEQHSNVDAHDETNLDSLKSPKLVQNLNAIMSDDANRASCRNVLYNPDNLFVDLDRCLKGFLQNDAYKNEIHFNVSLDVDVPRNVTAGKTECSVDSIETNFGNFDLNDGLHAVLHNFEFELDKGAKLVSGAELQNSSDVKFEAVDSISGSTKMLQNCGEDLCSSVDESPVLSRGCDSLSKNEKSDELDGRVPPSLAMRDSRHTLDEPLPSRSWYEDPAVIALACSCGIACTSQLPPFDIIAILGLLFAVISLCIALIART